MASMEATTVAISSLPCATSGVAKLPRANSCVASLASFRGLTMERMVAMPSTHANNTMATLNTISCRRSDSNWRIDCSLARLLMASLSARKTSMLPTSLVSRGRHSVLIFWIATSFSPWLPSRVISSAIGP